ncbi:class I SAM-dependent methyltransferase [bacterium]|nr:class I SAM-dependent methyltransferase [candidate division CSSED10-310 bacterium]
MANTDSAELYDFFHRMPRQGPGSPRNTAACIDLVRPFLPPAPRILEIGAGTGDSAIEIAQRLPGHIIALDIDEKALDILTANAIRYGVNDRITTCVGSMTDLRFSRGSFDLIWSETAAYFMGFRQALEYWRQFLRKNGLLVVSELSWLRENPPEDAMAFWDMEYPAMAHLETNLWQVHAAGFTILESFVLDREEWESHYYSPMEKLITERLQEDAENPRLRALCEQLSQEIDLFRRYSPWFGFVVIIARKTMAA